MKQLSFPRIPIVLTVLALAVVAAPAQSADVKTIDGVPHVMNPEKPRKKAETVKLEELWRVGGEDDEEIFGVITQVVAGSGGEFFMLDSQLNEIKVYDKDGEWLRNIGREGEGPGEFRAAFGMFRVPGGNIGILQTFPGKVVTLTPDGEPGGEFPLPEIEGDGFQVLFGGRYAGDNLALVYGLNKPSQTGFTQESVLALVDADRNSKQLHSTSSGMDAAAPVISEQEWDTFRNRWTASPRGQVYSAITRGAYEITEWGPDGKVVRVIERDYPDHVRSDVEKEELLEIYKGFTRQIPLPGIKYEIEDAHNPIGQVYARPDGTLWVLTSRGMYGREKGVLGIFDVFDKDGEYVREVTLKGEGNPRTDGYFFVEDRLFVVTDFLAAMMALQGGPAGEDDVDDDVEAMQVISYALD